MKRSLNRDGWLKERVAHWAVRLKVRPCRVRVQKMTRKWASCSTSGTITLASDLATRKTAFQDFVIAHELLHLRVRNHSKLFKALMTAHLPNWRRFNAARRWPSGSSEERR
jgi:predicted metal-dependent hydrolase